MERVCFAFEQVGTSEDFQEPPRSVTSITNHHHYHYYSLPKNFHLAWHHLPHHYHHPFTSFLFLLYLYNFSWVFTDGGKQIHQELNSRAVLAVNNAVFSRFKSHMIVIINGRAVLSENLRSEVQPIHPIYRF